MSNQVVGQVYLQVIEKVIAASQNDFEEFGVDQSTLDEMKQGWQEKLSALKVASFPWDPQPDPPRQPPTVPSMKNDAVAPPSVSAPQDLNFPNAGIKAERGYEPPMSSYPQGVPVNGYNPPSGYNGDIAQQRAQALVAQRLNNQQTHPNMVHPHQQHSGQVPMHNQQRMMPGQVPQQRPPQQMQQRPQQSHVYQSQTDGSGDAMADWIAFKAAREAAGVDGPEGRLAADLLMRSQLDAMAAHQDSGLMMPLSDMPKGRKRKNITRVLQAQEADRTASGTTSLPGPAPFDGADEDVKEEDPDDAINSDLDDPDDDLDGADGSDDETMDYMLCTYDKVQRVKNKWKCTLKDGILCTNKKEYLFHKATAELEF